MFTGLLRSTYRCGLPPSIAARRMTRPPPFKSTFRMCNSRQITSSAFRMEPKTRVSFLKGAGVSVAGVGIGVFFSKRSPVYCESYIAAPEMNRKLVKDELPPPPTSSVSIYELSFGTVAGLCAGVFIKKGAKAAAFLLGGVFVLLQYFVSFSVIKVDWGVMATKFERMFYSTDATGQKKTPTVYALFRWVVNFLTADFQPRASFVAGLMLGLRIG